jgi:hypothetical protein
MSKAHTAWSPVAVPSSVQALLDDPAAEVTKDSSAFWVLVAALKRFMVCLLQRCALHFMRVPQDSNARWCRPARTAACCRWKAAIPT